MVKFALRLKETRISNKVTQKALAEFLNIKEASYQHYEYGKREPNYETLFKFCDYSQVSSDFLLDLSDDPTRK